MCCRRCPGGSKSPANWTSGASSLQMNFSENSPVFSIGTGKVTTMTAQFLNLGKWTKILIWGRIAGWPSFNSSLKDFVQIHQLSIHLACSNWISSTTNSNSCSSSQRHVQHHPSQPCGSNMLDSTAFSDAQVCSLRSWAPADFSYLMTLCAFCLFSFGGSPAFTVPTHTGPGSA